MAITIAQFISASKILTLEYIHMGDLFNYKKMLREAYWVVDVAGVVDFQVETHHLHQQLNILVTHYHFYFMLNFIRQLIYIWLVEQLASAFSGFMHV